MAKRSETSGSLSLAGGEEAVVQAACGAFLRDVMPT